MSFVTDLKEWWASLESMEYGNDYRLAYILFASTLLFGLFWMFVEKQGNFYLAFFMASILLLQTMERMSARNRYNNLTRRLDELKKSQ